MSNWLGVVSANHVARGVQLGIAQIGHGKRAGLARMLRGDTLVYYSPVKQLGNKTSLQEFTAFGEVAGDEIWQADEGDFHPFRRAVRYQHTRTVALAAVRDNLDLTAQPNWGNLLRRGLIPITDHDVEVLKTAMMAP